MAGLTGSEMGRFLQQVAEAVSSVLKLDVTIVDRNLLRLAGTGRYKQGNHLHAPTSSSFQRQFQTGTPQIIAEAGQDPACLGCSMVEDCPEKAHIAYPLVVDGQVEAVIGLVAFDEAGRQKLVRKAEDYMEFLSRMAELVAGSFRERRAAQAVEEAHERVRGIVEAMQQGILAIDQNDTVILCNSAARALPWLAGRDPVGGRLSDWLPGHPLRKVVESGRGFRNREFAFPIGPQRFQHLVMTATPLLSQGRVVGAVAVVQDLHEVKSMVNAFSAGHPTVTFESIVGEAPSLQLAKERALRAAAGTATVLIRGESGTGKELFARAIHNAGSRSAGPFLAVNCAAIPEDLLESEFFGYEEGAFTGARRGGKPGKFELADGGTLFLDEIGDMSLGLQAKLLRVLDGGFVERVGGTRPIPINVRIVAATHRDLEAMVEAREFREDLFYRLNVIPIEIPPLRQRTGDIPLLLEHFGQKYARSLRRALPQFTPEALELLMQYPWPGNVRELENTVEYLLNVTTGPVITPDQLPPRILSRVAAAPGGASLRERERQAIKEALDQFGRDGSGKLAAARALGISRATLYRKIREYGL